MRFHTKKCKVLSINHFNKNLFSELPFYLYPYHINDILLDYCDKEMDLGIVTTKRFNFNNHRSEILSKAVINSIYFEEPVILCETHKNAEIFI